MIRNFCFLLLFFCSVPVMAQNGQLQKLPDVEKMDIQTFVAQSDKVKKAFQNDPFLGFEVQLPTNFIERSSDVLKNYDRNGRLYGEIFQRWYGCSGCPAVF